MPAEINLMNRQPKTAASNYARSSKKADNVSRRER
jgi:hypothetical protein